MRGALCPGRGFGWLGGSGFNLLIAFDMKGFSAGSLLLVFGILGRSIV